MNCSFCAKKSTPKHLCSELLAYDMLRDLFLSVLYTIRPSNGNELHTGIMERIETHKLFEDSSDIHSVISHYLGYFLEEFDVS